MIDPPNGWRYGFPKPLPDDVDNVEEWLILEGYPKDMIDGLGEYFYTRSWMEEVEE